MCHKTEGKMKDVHHADVQRIGAPLYKKINKDKVCKGPESSELVNASVAVLSAHRANQSV